MSKVYVEEFLFRGRCDENEPGQQGTYHVVLAQFVDAPGGKQIARWGPMSPERAEENGFDLASILGAITAQAARDAAALSEQLAAAEAVNEEAARQIAAQANLISALTKDLETATKAVRV